MSHYQCTSKYQLGTTQFKFNIHSESLSPPHVNIHGVSQGSVLGPILFIIYIIPIKSMFHKYTSINYHLYSDDIFRYIVIS